jgi:hypothetical protein
VADYSNPLQVRRLNEDSERLLECQTSRRDLCAVPMTLYEIAPTDRHYCSYLNGFYVKVFLKAANAIAFIRQIGPS